MPSLIDTIKHGTYYFFKGDKMENERVYDTCEDLMEEFEDASDDGKAIILSKCIISTGNVIPRNVKTLRQLKNYARKSIIGFSI